ncbi:DUF3017 domain-containing protein [Streptomyces sp. NPDC021096]|uniref:DUF3017 domain-containing protein n=1 Tax=Streptomyces sp. NPDC021096 TaxID=3154792 RepID=UPI0033FDEFA1
MRAESGTPLDGFAAAVNGAPGSGASENGTPGRGSSGGDAPGADASGQGASKNGASKNGAQANGAQPGDAGQDGGAGAGPAAGSGKPSRRPPRLTRDTARPEGGGRAAPGDAPAPARQWPLLAVLGATGLGLLVVAFDAFRVGTILVGLAMIGGAVLRWVLPDVGMLAVRSRFTDMLTYGGMGLAIVLLALMAQPHPWLKIPFLDDVLHFTVQ